MRKRSRLYGLIRGRRLIDRTAVHDDLRTLGLVFIGFGLLTILLTDQRDGMGVLLIVLGLVVDFYGLTQSKDKRSQETSDKE